MKWIFKTLPISIFYLNTLLLGLALWGLLVLGHSKPHESRSFYSHSNFGIHYEKLYGNSRWKPSPDRVLTAACQGISVLGCCTWQCVDVHSHSIARKCVFTDVPLTPWGLLVGVLGVIPFTLGIWTWACDTIWRGRAPHLWRPQGCIWYWFRCSVCLCSILC